jgi:hypothetical protein
LEFGACDLEFTGQTEIPKTKAFYLWLARFRDISEQETQMRLPCACCLPLLTSLSCIIILNSYMNRCGQSRRFIKTKNRICGAESDNDAE